MKNKEIKGVPLQNIYFDYEEEILSKFYIVLAGPRVPRNVGAVARAMMNMGFSNLIIAGAKDIITDDSYALARDAASLLDRAVFTDNLIDGLKEMQYIVGTTRRPTKYSYEILPVRQIVPSLLELSQNNKIAIVFGPEDKGLIMEDLGLCNSLIRIPTSSKLPSINLSQSVLLVCSEIFQAAATFEPEEKKQKEKPPFEVVEGLFQHLGEFLKEIEYRPYDVPEYTMQLFRQMFRSCELNSSDIGLLRSILHKTKYYIKYKVLPVGQGKESRENQS